MLRFTTAHALRAAGLAVWAVVTFKHYLGPAADAQQGPIAQMLGPFWCELVSGVLLLAFASCLWFNLREVPVEHPTRMHRARLVAQIIAGLVMDTDLMYVAAGQTALVLERRAALRWLGAQMLLLALWVTLLEWLHAFEPPPAYKDAASALAFGVTLLSLFVWQCFAFCVGWLAAREARQRRALAQANGRLQAAQRELAAKSRLDERLHLSRELHDSLGHHLVALHLQLDLAQRAPQHERQNHVVAGAQIARGMLGEVRRVVSTLREEPAPDLRAELLALQATLPEPHLHIDCAADAGTLPPMHAHALLRCLQEGVNNTLRHAAAHNLWVEIETANGGTTLSLRDDGTGVDTVQPGNGLTGMRERIEALGGSLRLHSEPGQGFAIEVRLPLLGSPA